MDDKDLQREIYKAWSSRGYEIGWSNYHIMGGFEHFFDLEEAKKQFEQFIRLSTYRPHPMEEGYYRVKSRIDALTDIYNLINTNLAFCLTSNDNYLRKFAELINERRVNNI